MCDCDSVSIITVVIAAVLCFLFVWGNFREEKSLLPRHWGDTDLVKWRKKGTGRGLKCG